MTPARSTSPPDDTPSTPGTEFRARVRALLGDGVSPADVAAKLLADLKVNARASRLLAVPVGKFVSDMLRQDDQAVEEAVVRRHQVANESAGRPWFQPIAEYAPDVRDLLATKFHVPGVGFVTWGSATVAHHEARIEFLARHRDGIQATIDRHRTVMDAIAEAGVACLADLPTVPEAMAS